MVYIAVKSLYPADKGGKVGKLFLETLKKFPEDEKIIKRLLAMVRSTHKGIDAITLYETVKGKYDEALIWVGTVMNEYSSIDNFRYKADTYLNVGEALPIVGLSDTS